MCGIGWENGCNGGGMGVEGVVKGVLKGAEGYNGVFEGVVGLREAVGGLLGYWGDAMGA